MTTKTRDTIIAAMDILTNMSVGAIGEGGPTIKELDDCVESNGSSWGDDADYHTVQYAWRILERLK